MTTDHTSPVTPVTVPDADVETREQIKQRNKDFVADVAQDTADAATVAAADAADASATAASKAADVTTDAAAKVAATATEVTSKVQDAVAPTASKASGAVSDAASATVAKVKRAADPAPTKAQEVAVAVTEAAQQVPGVYRLGGLAAGAVASMRYRVSGAVSTPGVSTAVDPDGAARVDLRLVISYPAGIPDVVAAVREQVLRAASEIVSGPVQVDITVADVHGPFDPIDPPAIEAGTTSA